MYIAYRFPTQPINSEYPYSAEERKGEFAKEEKVNTKTQAKATCD